MYMTDRFYELDVFCFKEVIHTAKRFTFKLPYTFSTHTSRSFICKENIPHSPVFRKHDPMKAGGWEHQSSRPPAFAFQFIGLFDQVRAELTDLFSFLRKHRPMPALLGLPVKVPGPVGLAVVLQLQRAAAGKNLCRIHKAIQRLLILPQNLWWIGRIDASGDNRNSRRFLFTQYILQRVKIMDLDDRRGIRDEPVGFELLELPVKRGSGNVHDHRPI